MIVVVLHSRTCLLLKTLDIVLRIRDFLSIRLDLSLLNPSATNRSPHTVIPPSSTPEPRLGEIS